MPNVLGLIGINFRCAVAQIFPVLHLLTNGSI